MLRAKFPGEKRVTLGRSLLLTLVIDVNEGAQTLLEKDLDVVGHESKLVTRNRLTNSRTK